MISRDTKKINRPHQFVAKHVNSNLILDSLKE